MQPVLFLVVFVSAIVVAVDASRLGAKRGALGGGTLDMGPASWFFATLLIWIVALPCYLVARPRLVRRAQALATHPQFADGGMVTAAAPSWGPWGDAPGYYPTAAAAGRPYGFAGAAPVQGWYANPTGPGMRWWDGTSWTERVG